MPQPDPASFTALFPLESIPDPGAREAVIEGPHGPLPVFIVRRGETVRAYVNSCPHLGVALNWKPDTFLDPAGETIVCAMHAAVFRIEDGHCEAGPCQGRALRRLEVAFRNGIVAVGGA